MSNEPIDTASPEWAALLDHCKDVETLKISDLFADNPDRFEEFSLTLDGLLFDYSKNSITAETLEHLCALGKSRGVEEARNAMVRGDSINASENRAVLHMALRGGANENVHIDGESVNDFVQSSLQHMENITEQIRSNPHVKDVVNIGIGGSDLGPRMVYKALRPFASGPNVHFISNIDARALSERLEGLEPEHTIIVITSKTFSTLETITNAETAKSWLLEKIEEKKLGDHLFAISMHTDKAIEFGVPANHILPMREWIGGRFSLWSTVGLSISISYGFDVFKDLLDGAKAADEHFKTAPMEQNIPMIMALLGVWYRNIKGYSAQAVLPYSHDLRDFPRYLQQLDMESNGKGVTQGGQETSVETGPIIFGEAGTNAQHAFMQLLHQSAEIIPADFIVFIHPAHDLDNHQTHLFANAIAQARALMEGANNPDEPHKHFPGNRPSSTLMLERLDAFHLGMLIALYEHKIFVQGVIWGINSFDQWGVELGKEIHRELSSLLGKSVNIPAELDSSTAAFINIFRNKFIKS